MFTIFDRLSAHFQMRQKTQAHRNWFLVNNSFLVYYKGPELYKGCEPIL